MIRHGEDKPCHGVDTLSVITEWTSSFTVLFYIIISSLLYNNFI